MKQSKNFLIIFFSFILILGFTPYSAESRENQKDLCPKELEYLPILQNGRLKPLYIHVKETFSHLGAKKIKGNLSPVQVFCLISLEGHKVPNTLNIKTPIQHVELRKFLELEKGQKDISFKALGP